MFPGADSNRFTVPYSDQYSLYSKLLDDDDDGDGDVDIDSNIHNPDSSFSFFDQNITHPNFLDHEQFELKNTFMEQHHEAQPILTAFEEFTMADASSNSTSMGAYGFAGGHSVTGISTGAVGDVKDDKVRKNGVWSKKDRHSKINTAQGLRDRRMRLSLDVARRFFGLQDMLGFDKASKTVDWLLSKSQSEINEVAHSKNIATARSDIEEASEVVNKDDVSQSGAMDSGKLNKMSGSMKKKKKKKTGKMSFRNRFSNLLDKESREKARARARERTKEKKMICRSQNHNKLDDNVEHFSNMDQSLLTQVKKPEFLNLGPHVYSYVDQRDTMADESLGNTSYWNPTSTIFSHLHQQSNEASQQVQFGEIQFYARPWESYN